MKKLAVLTVSIAAATLTAQAADKITFDEHVMPIFRNACLNCHNPDKKKAGLDLSTYQAALLGSENGKVLESGNPAGSLLLKTMKHTEEPKMPPKGDKVPEAELALIEKWIAGQLLENASGKVVAASKNNVAAVAVSLERPPGPPPMPGELPIEPVVRTKATNALVALATSPWAPVVAIGGQKQIILYNTDTLEPLGVLPFPEGFPSVIRFSRNGQLLLTGGGLGGKSGKVVLWDIKTGERVATVGNEFDQVLGADISADQQFVALGGPNKLVKIYSTKDGKMVASMKKHTDWVTAISFSPDGKYLASADRNGGIQIWEGATGKEFNALPGHKAMVTALSFMPGVLASASEDGKIMLWDAKEGKEIRNWAAHGGGVQWVDFTPDGRLVSCGRDKTAKVWDQTGKALGASQPFGDITLRAGLAGDRVVAGDWTGKIKVSSIDGKTVHGELTANPPSVADRLTADTKRLSDAQAALPGLQQQVEALDKKVQAEQLVAEEKRKADAAAMEAAKAAPGQVEKRIADAKAAVEALTKQRDAAPEAEREAFKPKIEEAQKQLAPLPAELAKVKAELEKKLAAAKTPPPAPKPSPAQEELAKAKAALAQTQGTIASAQGALGKWKLAQAFQVVFQSKQTLTQKQAQYDGLVQTVKEALAPADKVQQDIASAEKQVSEGPGNVQAKEASLAQAQGALDQVSKTVGAAEAVIPTKEKALKALTDAVAANKANVDAVAKKHAQLTAELEPLKKDLAAKKQGTPEWDEANAKVQVKEGEVAQIQVTLNGAKARPQNLETPEGKAAQAAVAEAKQAVEKARQNTKGAQDAVEAAKQEVAKAKQSLEQTQKTLADLKAKAPEITAKAQATKAEAERAAAAAEKELAAAKADAEKRRADYEAAKGGGVKAASL